MFANHISDKGLISKIYKELIQLNRKKEAIELKNGQSTGTDILMANRKPSIINQKRQIKHSEITPHIYWKGYYQKDKKTNAVKNAKEREAL